MRSAYILIVALTLGAATARAESALPGLGLPNACVKFLLGVPVLGRPVSRAMLNLNYHVLRTNLALSRGASPDDPTKFFVEQFKARLDRELKRLRPALKIELLERLLQYDDLHDPDELTRSGYWDNPLRVSGAYPESLEELEAGAPLELNSRELLIAIEGPAAWSNARGALTLDILDRLIAMIDRDPERFHPALRAMGVPLLFNLDVFQDLLTDKIARALAHADVGDLDKRDALEAVLAGLGQATRDNEALSIKLNWQSEPADPFERGALAVLKASIARQNELHARAAGRLNALRAYYAAERR